MDVELGIIEGFYGRPWSWEDRTSTVSALAPHGYRFYLYAPKADPYLRRRWQEDHPADVAASIARFAEHCQREGVRFGIGISPYEVFLGFDNRARQAFQRKLTFFDELGVDDLAILFDDMRGGDTPELARRQSEIVAWARERSAAERLLVCPSYYSDDPVLDRVFGARPAGYVEDLAARLAPDIEIFWTGEEVCSREISTGHLQRVTEQLGRKPFLWDNYPVNDGQRMSQFLHLRGFSGRPATAGDHIAAHGVNPALQPTLSRIPARTLAESYRLGEDYQYGEAFRRVAREVLGAELAQMVWEDLLLLQDVGLDRLGDKEAWLRERYGETDHPGAKEIIGWLNGDYRITDELVKTQ
jgi:hyaluronoglucosaminidase